MYNPASSYLGRMNMDLQRAIELEPSLENGCVTLKNGKTVDLREVFEIHDILTVSVERKENGFGPGPRNDQGRFRKRGTQE